MAIVFYSTFLNVFFYFCHVFTLFNVFLYFLQRFLHLCQFPIQRYSGWLSRQGRGDFKQRVIFKSVSLGSSRCLGSRWPVKSRASKAIDLWLMRGCQRIASFIETLSTSGLCIPCLWAFMAGCARSEASW